MRALGTSARKLIFCVKCLAVSWIFWCVVEKKTEALQDQVLGPVGLVWAFEVSLSGIEMLVLSKGALAYGTTTTSKGMTAF
jgi:hypothetical protein